MKQSQAVSRPANKRNSLRIIGGEWRGRKLEFADAEGLRPTPDRVRETLFNWLMPIIQGATCLDLFAGSGALGMEALSRGAAHVIMLDNQAAAISGLRNNLSLLAAEDHATLLNIEAQRYLEQSPQPVDIVFLDPPYHRDLLAPCMEKLQAGWLKAGAYIYFEANRDEAIPELPANWTLLKEKTAGQVRYFLAKQA
ncbi:MAG: 16S rRNA (guanine(966)-N(2))-methyltransferase RsmD [Gammaproteobacteria bacterium]|nr:16S rRNA (guanine(966)-N(2))-methyltransferase RsmD [Gammaproteobacteria bacterium]